MASCSSQGEKIRDVDDFNHGWKFSLDADSTAAAPEYKDKEWRVVNLPHDWSIEGEFSDHHPATAGGGALPGGYGVYRKHFKTPDLTGGRRVYLCFDGVYWQSTVYVNGKKAGFRPNGYIGFEYDITDLLNMRGDNVVAVTVDNTNQPNSRWYSGSGIYRNVRLKVLNALHVEEQEVFVSAYDISSESAKVKVDLEIIGAEGCNVKIDILSPAGEIVATAQDSVSAGSIKTFDGLTVENPRLWSPQNPRVYKAVITAVSNGKIVDEYSATFGIRYFDFDVDKGFSLNGKPMKINGVCMHHDLGALGAAVNHRAIQRQLEILRDMGCNAIRTSHNPPAPELLNLCDSMGFVVMDEAFDMWARKKTPNDYAQYFAEWHERDLMDFVKRDRNHPSVLMWSIGNEILEQWSDINTDTLSIEKANLMFNFAAQLSDCNKDNTSGMHVNSLLCKKLAELVKSIDSTRPVLTGNNETEPFNLLFKSNALDIIGFNYHENNWGEAFKKKYPGMPLVITESTSALQTRGHYITPADTQYLWPVRWDIPFDTEHHKCSAYDNVRTPWGSTHEATLKEYMKYPWVSGIFVWTGFDYLGEPTPYGWPARSSYFGIVDLAGFPKDVYYLYKSLWAEDAYVLHLLPHWNWSQGDTVDVIAYTNMKDVELFLNGESLGKQVLDSGKLHLSWRVPYQPGELRAVGRSVDDIEISSVKHTASAPYRLASTADRYSLAADGNDLSFLTVDVVDNKGVIVPDANNLIKFTVEGPAEIVALDNGDQCCHEKFQGVTQHTAFNGKCLCIIRSIDGKKGRVVVRATADGLAASEVEIFTK